MAAAIAGGDCYVPDKREVASAPCDGGEGGAPNPSPLLYSKRSAGKAAFGAADEAFKKHAGPFPSSSADAWLVKMLMPSQERCRARR